MSVVNQLSASNSRRDMMVNSRNGFTYAANIVILGLAFILFQFLHDRVLQFKILCLTCLGLGGISSLFFMCTINEVKLTESANILDTEYKRMTMGEQAALENEKKRGQGKKNTDWLKEPTFYIFGVVYASVRIAVCVTMTCLSFYLGEVTGFRGTEDNPTPTALALVPLFSYLISLIFSLFFQQRLTRAFANRMMPMLFAIFVIVITSTPLIFLDQGDLSKTVVYPCIGF